MTPEEFAAKLRRIRIKLGLTQVEAARIAGSTGNSLARWERGERCPPSEKDVLSREGVLRKLRARGKRA